MNSIYAGDLELQKFYVVDPISKIEKRNNGELDKYVVKNHHESIIDRKLYDKAVELYKKVKDKGRYNEKYINNYPLTGKLRCGVCGKIYTRGVRKGKVQDTIYYQCDSTKNPIKVNGKNVYKTCRNHRIQEKKIYEILADAKVKVEDIKTIYFYKDYRVKIVLYNMEEIEKTWVLTSYKDWVTKERLDVMKEKRRCKSAKTNN